MTILYMGRLDADGDSQARLSLVNRLRFG